MNAAELERIRRSYYPRYWPLRDHLERSWRRAREQVLGVDLSIFDKTIRYYRESRGETVTRRQALARALDKKRHKLQWFETDRETEEAIRHFYQEVDVYPFRQPYLWRFGGYRWIMRLVEHVPSPSLLEYGCGSAVLTEYLADRFSQAQFTVADIPSVALDFVAWKKRTYRYPYTILTVGPGKEGIPLREAYDLIFCRDVLEHTLNPLEIVQSFLDHLSPGGVLVINFLKSCKGENLQTAFEQREPVKELLQRELIPVKAIDDDDAKDGLYVRDN